MIKSMLILAPLLIAISCSQPAPAIEVRDAWARATAPRQSSGAIYATFVNSGPDDRLTSVGTDRAEMAALHSSETVNGVARMRMASDLVIPAGSTVEFAPSGTHVMLEGLKAPLVTGQTLSLELRFAKAGTRNVTVSVAAAGSR